MAKALAIFLMVVSPLVWGFVVEGISYRIWQRWRRKAVAGKDEPA